jgi:citrate lyase subunit beta / citryl-CoA lyase
MWFMIEKISRFVLQYQPNGKMKKTLAIAGNSGPKIRSDCEIVLELQAEGETKIELASKVKVLYGESIKKLITEILDYFGVKHAVVKINDTGALPFVIAARMESAIKQLIDTDLEYLPSFLDENSYSTTRDRFRFSRLYLPGNNPGLMINAGLHSADGIILDLEDSVAPEKKDEAKVLVRNALRQINFNGAERMVRINQGERGLKDLHFIIPHNVNLVLVPKCENRDYIRQVDDEISRIKRTFNLTNQVFLMPIIESALGVENSFEIARGSENIVAIAMGLEDFTADLGVPRTLEGRESFYARTRLVVAARAAGIQPIDSVFSDVADTESLKKNVLTSKSLGFEGMGCIHPRQIQVIKQGFAPDKDEIEKSKKIVLAFEKAKLSGLGVVALGSKMIDPPVVARAQKIIDLALRIGLISDDWQNDIQNDSN